MGFKLLNSHISFPGYLAISLCTIINNIKDNCTVVILKAHKIKLGRSSCAIYAIGTGSDKFTEVGKIII